MTGLFGPSAQPREGADCWQTTDWEGRGAVWLSQPFLILKGHSHPPAPLPPLCPTSPPHAPEPPRDGAMQLLPRALGRDWGSVRLARFPQTLVAVTWESSAGPEGLGSRVEMRAPFTECPSSVLRTASPGWASFFPGNPQASHRSQCLFLLGAGVDGAVGESVLEC